MPDSKGETIQPTMSSPTNNSDGNVSHSNVDYEHYDSDADSFPWVGFGRPMPEETERLKYRDRVHEQIGMEMIGETFVCPVDPFVDHYLPPLPGSVDVTAVVEELAKASLLIKDPATQSYRFAGFAEGFGAEDDDADEVEREEVCFAFSPLTAIGDAIRAILKGMGVRINPFRLALCLKPWLKGGHLPLDAMACKVDGCITSASLDFDGAVVQPAGELCPTDLVVPIALKACHHDYTTNNLQIVVSANHIFNEDARRTFSYGISIEGEYASIWYFSRSHSMKAESFDFIKEPELLVKVLVSLFCATEEQLGLDPHITLIPGRDYKTYLYELPPDGRTKLEPQFFMATHKLDGDYPANLADPATRVWRVIQVVSKRVLDPVPGATELVLKDTWIGWKIDTEYDIQQRLFCDIRAFAGGDWGSHPLLEHFSAKRKAEFKEALAKFEDYFCVIQQQHIGARSKRLLPATSGVVVQKPDWSLFFGEKPWSMQRQTLIEDENYRPKGCRLFRVEQRCFFILQHECPRLDELPTLGDAMDVVSQTWHALLMMFCAGWIHRDICPGNILALQEDGGHWQVKLSDLEYAIRFPPDEGRRSADKAGTPIFTALELLRGMHYYEPEIDLDAVEDSDTTDLQSSHHRRSCPPIPSSVTQNLQHDLESLFWSVLYLVTVRISHDKSQYFAKKLFTDTEGALYLRNRWFTHGFKGQFWESIHPPVKRCATALDDLRRALFNIYRLRHPIDCYDLSKYSYICAYFINFFKQLKKPRKNRDWVLLPLA